MQGEKIDVLEQLRDKKFQLTKSQKLIRKYLLEHYQEVAMMSAVEFGEKVNVSDATISRFVRTIGFENFYEFKNYLRDGIKNFDTPYKRVVKLPANKVRQDERAILQEMLQKIGEQDMQNIEKLMSGIDMVLLERAVDAIFKAKRIYLLAIGSSAALIDFFNLHLRRMGFNVESVSDGSNYNPERLSPMTADDLLLTMSFPRYSSATYDAIVYAKKKQTTVLTIMDSNFSAISSYSDIVIPLQTENVTFFNSLVVPMLLGNWLIMLLLERDRDRIQEKIRENSANTVMLNIKI